MDDEEYFEFCVKNSDVRIERGAVHIYRPGAQSEIRVGLHWIDGEGPVQGFRLNLARMWRKL